MKDTLTFLLGLAAFGFFIVGAFESSLEGPAWKLAGATVLSVLWGQLKILRAFRRKWARVNYAEDLPTGTYRVRTVSLDRRYATVYCGIHYYVIKGDDLPPEKASFSVRHGQTTVEVRPVELSLDNGDPAESRAVDFFDER